jgi:hypothetical protein
MARSNRGTLMGSAAIVDPYDPRDVEESGYRVVPTEADIDNRRKRLEPSDEARPVRVSSRPEAPRGPPPWIDDNDRVLTVDETIALLGVSKFTLLRMRRRLDVGGLAFVQLSPKRIGYRLGDIRSYLQARRVGVLTEAA